MTPEQLPLWDDRFWRDELAQLSAGLDPVLVRVLLAGIERGVEALPVELQVLVDWDLVNRDALQFARQYSYGLIRGINDTTRRQVQTAVAEWIESGQPLDSLATRLANTFGNRRALAIAQTESTRAYASGNLLAWTGSGLVGGKQWYTARDSLVCPICGPLHGTIVELDAPWQFSQATLAANPMLAKALRGGTSITAPPSHPGCRCWLLPVVVEAWDPEELERKLFDNVQRERLAQ